MRRPELTAVAFIKINTIFLSLSFSILPKCACLLIAVLSF